MDATTQPQIAEVQKFIDTLVKKRFAGEENLTDEVKEELKKETLERMNNFILEATLDAFSDEDVELFSKMIEEKKSPQEIEQFTKEHIQDYAGFMADVLQEFQEVYLEG